MIGMPRSRAKRAARLLARIIISATSARLGELGGIGLTVMISPSGDTWILNSRCWKNSAPAARRLTAMRLAVCCSRRSICAVESVPRARSSSAPS